MNRQAYSLQRKQASFKTTRLEWSFLLLFFLFVLTWAAVHPYGSGYNFPDEVGRMVIPEYIFQHGSLPTGNEEAVQIAGWGFSYAYYPFFAGPLVSALFMKIASLFTDTPTTIYFAARLTSVLAATGTAYFVLKAGKRFFGSPYHWLFTGMVVLIPQFIFLGAYVNNDIIAIFASSIIFYAWIWAYQEDWQLKNCLLLAVGIIICALSYYNAYAWVLASIIFFFGSWLIKHRQNKNFQQLWKYTGVIVALVFIGIAFFFLRNLMIHGDLLGLSTVEKMSELNAIDNLKPSLRPTPNHLGMSVWEMLTATVGGTTWIVSTFKSFIAVFGMMNVFAPRIFYGAYAIIYLIGGVLFIWRLVLFFRKRNQQQNFSLSILLGLNLLLTIITPILLSIYYSYNTDYQAQGRYVYPMVIALMFLLSYGLIRLIQQLIQKEAFRRLCIGLFFGLQSLAALLCFYFIFLP